MILINELIGTVAQGSLLHDSKPVAAKLYQSFVRYLVLSFGKKVLS